MPHQRPAGVEQLVEQLQQLALRGLGFAALGLDPLTHVTVEEVDGPARRNLGRGGMFSAKLDELRERNAGVDQLHPGRDRLEVVNGVEGLAASVARLQQSRLLEALEHRLRNTAALRQLDKAKCLG